jgi:hypothetical protein
VTTPLTTNAVPPKPPGPICVCAPEPRPPEPEPKPKPRVKLKLKLRYARAGGCRRVAVLTVAGTGLGRVARAGLRHGSRRLRTDRTRPFRVKVTRRMLRGRARARLTVGVRLEGGRLVKLRVRVRGLC